MPPETQGFKYSVPVGAMIAGLVMNALYAWYPQWCWRQAQWLKPKSFQDERFGRKREASALVLMASVFMAVGFWTTDGSASPDVGTFICLFFAVLSFWLASASLRSTVEFRDNELVCREGKKVKVINLSDITDVKLGRGVILVDYGASAPLRVSAFHDQLTTLIAMLRYHRPEKSTT